MPLSEGSWSMPSIHTQIHQRLMCGEMLAPAAPEVTVLSGRQALGGWGAQQVRE